MLGAIGGTAAVGLATGLGAAQDGDGTAQATRDDYWLVDGENASTVVTEDTAEDVSSDGDLVVARGTAVDGAVKADGHVLVGQGASVAGLVDAAGAVVTDFVVDLDGGVAAADDVVLGVDIVRAKRAYEAGDLVRAGDLPMRGGIVVGDDVATEGDVAVGPESDVEGSVTAERPDGSAAEQTQDDERRGPPTVILGSYVAVAEDLRAAGDAVLGPESSVGGTVTAGGTTAFADGATFDRIRAERIEQGEAADVFAAYDENEAGDEVS